VIKLLNQPFNHPTELLFPLEFGRHDRRHKAYQQPIGLFIFIQTQGVGEVSLEVVPVVEPDRAKEEVVV
jgi:hypothetical protein